MPNPYFRCKQFTIYQDRCGMKVGTDGVLVGAWTEINNATTILDVGTGTGLIALMLAQRSNAYIDAIEIDAAASQQARENVRHSPWPTRIRVHHTALQTYCLACPQRYDLVVTNPPFFEQGVPAPSQARRIARHNESLSVTELLQATQTLLARPGRLVVIYPIEMAERLLNQAADFGLICRRKLYVKPKARLPIKRILLDLTNADPVCKETEATLVIEEETRYHYTAQFIALIRDYYLKY